MAKSKKVINDSTDSSFRFLYSKKEQYRQYRTYSKEYNRLKKIYPTGMTKKYDYKTYVDVRKTYIENAIKLGDTPYSNKKIAKEQIRISRHAGRIRQEHYYENIKKAIERERSGKPLNRLQEIMLEKGTYVIQVNDGKDEFGNVKWHYERRIYDVTQREIMDEAGVSREIYEAAKMDDDVEDVTEIFGYIK